MQEKTFTQHQVRSGFTRIFFTGFAFNFCIAALFWFKGYARHSVANSLMLCAPLLLIVFYWRQYRNYATQSEANRDQFADSLYFLGFLFTLMHLSFALVPWIFTPSMDSFYLLAQFGMAITTTLAGLFLRLTMSQFPEQNADEKASGISAEQALSRTTAAFIAQLEISIQRLEGINEKSIPCLEEQTNAFLANMTRANDEAINEIRKTRTAFGLAITKVLQNIDAKLEILITKVTEQQLALTKDFGNRIAGEVETTCKSLLSSFTELAKETLGETKGILERLKATVGNVNLQLGNKMQGLGKELDESTEAIKVHRERTQAMLLELNHGVLEQIQEITSIAKGEIHGIGPAVNTVLYNLKERGLVKMDEIATRVSTEVHADLSELILDTRTLLDSLKESTNQLKTFSQQMEYLNRIIPEMMDAGFKKSINDSIKSINDLTDQTRMLETQFKELTKVRVEEDFRSLRLSLAETAESLGNTNTVFKELNQESIETNDILQNEIRNIIDLRKQLVIELTASVELTQQVHENLIRGVQFLGKEFGRPS